MSSWRLDCCGSRSSPPFIPLRFDFFVKSSRTNIDFSSTPYKGSQQSMIDIMAFLTVLPGKAGEVLATIRSGEAFTASRPASPLVGIWTSEFGELNQIVLLFRSEDKDQADRLPASPLIRGPFILSSEIRMLRRQEPARSPAGKGNIYELRRYAFQPGSADRFFPLLSAALPARERYSKIVSWWRPATGETEQVLHLWSYRDLSDRARARAAALEDPNWQAFLSNALPVLRTMQSTVLIPAPFSPMQ